MRGTLSSILRRQIILCNSSGVNNVQGSGKTGEGKMKSVAVEMGFVMITVSGGGAMNGPRPPKFGVQIEQRDVNAMADCEAQVPVFEKYWIR